jgi:hypothetical protein
MIPNQGVMGLGNVAGTYVESEYRLSEGRLTRHEAQGADEGCVLGIFSRISRWPA